MNKRTQVLADADKLINGDRQEQYGTPKANFGRISAMWTAYLGVDISPDDVAVCMALLKACRLSNEKHWDGFVDGAAYFALAAELADT